MDPIYEPLRSLSAFFPEIQPQALVWKAYDLVTKTTDNAIYTFEHKLEVQLENEPKLSGDEKKNLIERTRSVVMLDFHTDAAKATLNLYREILQTILIPPITKLVLFPCEPVLDPISSLIPEPLKQFVDPNKIFEDVIVSIVNGSIDAVLQTDI